MNEEYLSQAQNLANRAHTSQVSLEETTDGEPIYFAITPEMQGCVAQGETIEEALNNLADARIDFIYFLLEDGLPVPEPSTLVTSSEK